MDTRLQQLSSFSRGVGDIFISRHPLRRDILVSYGVTSMDIYQDTVFTEEGRFYKVCIFRKAPDMWYVQDLFGDVLREDVDDKLPYIAMMTATGLPRLPKLSDRIIEGGKIYTVAAVRPFNRDLNTIFSVLVYPEREEWMDPLHIYNVRFRIGMCVLQGQDLDAEIAKGSTLVMDMLWGGCPWRYSFDKATWYPFSPVVQVVVPSDADTVFVQDPDGVTVGYNFIDCVEV